MLDAHDANIPHAWIAGDSEFGRVAAFRKGLRDRGERYCLDVPSGTVARDLEARPPRRRSRKTRRRAVPFTRVDAWAADVRPSRWKRFKVRPKGPIRRRSGPAGDGEKGPIEVEAVETRVRTKYQQRPGPGQQRIGPEERLVVIRSTGSDSRVWYTLSNAPSEVPLAELVRAHAERHRIEQVFEEAKAEGPIPLRFARS